jgi:tetraacyldisaccharide 4'-kinase
VTAASPLDAPPPSRSPWQRFYAAVLRRRARRLAARSRSLPRPVVSVGNLQWGGGGKTPVVAAIAAHLVARRRRVAILSRGYRRVGAAPVEIASAGDGLRLPVERAGDEPALLAALVPGAAVVVGADRHRAGRHALAELEPPPEVFVLDDAFSSLALRRDLDLLVFPAEDPFARGRLLPGGRLREPLAATARADAVLLTGTADAAAGARLAAALRPYGFTGPGFASALRPQAVVWQGAAPPAGAPLLFVAGTARPESFFALARAAGHVAAATLALPDHHPYPPRTLRRMARLAAARGAAGVLTTGKDAVKLRGRLALPLGELPVAAEPEPAFWAWLDDRLAALEGEVRG